MSFRAAILASAFTATASLASAQASPAQPLSNPGEWIQSDDYPAWAVQYETEGVVGVELSIDAAGAPLDCTVTESSEVADLDRIACEKLLQRARFKPATNSEGNPVASTWSNRVRFQLPEKQPSNTSEQQEIPEPQEIIVAFIIEKDGRVSDCTVTGADEEQSAEFCGEAPVFDVPSSSEDEAIRRRVVTTVKVEVSELPD